jgi:hypothetical protein
MWTTGGAQQIVGADALTVLRPVNCSLAARTAAQLNRLGSVCALKQIQATGNGRLLYIEAVEESQNTIGRNYGKQDISRKFSERN